MNIYWLILIVASANALVLIVFFELYAVILKIAANFSNVLKLVISFVAYLFIVLIVVLSFGSFFWWIPELQSKIQENNVALSVLTVAFGLSCLPSLYLFGKRHISTLRRLGFFRER